MKRKTGHERYLKHMHEADVIGSRFCGLFPGEPPRLVIMCGVGLGAESKVFKKHWPTCTVVGVDPLRDLALEFEGEFIEAALVRNPAKKTVRFFRVSGQQAASTIFRKMRRNRRNKPYIYPAITLDEVFQRYGSVGPVALWMDCEGSELAAMRGGPRCLAETRLLLVETTASERVDRVAFPDRERVFRFLRRSGFEQVFTWKSDSIWRRR